MSLNLAESISLVIAILLWLAFIASYIAYGNRLRAWAGRAIMGMSIGYLVILIPLFAHHVLGVNFRPAQEMEVAGIIVSFLASGSLLALTIAANGRWPWDREQRWNGHSGEDHRVQDGTGRQQARD